MGGPRKNAAEATAKGARAGAEGGRGCFSPGRDGESPALITPMRQRWKLPVPAADVKRRVHPSEKRQWLESAAAYTAAVRAKTLLRDHGVPKFRVKDSA